MTPAIRLRATEYTEQFRSDPEGLMARVIFELGIDPTPEQREILHAFGSTCYGFGQTYGERNPK